VETCRQPDKQKHRFARFTAVWRRGSNALPQGQCGLYLATAIGYHTPVLEEKE
jgi:hypothetical protein